MKSEDPNIIDSVCLPDDKVEELFAAMDKKEEEREDLREYPRFPFEHHGKVLISPIDPNSGHQTYRARVRNISCGGVCILHGAELAPGNEVDVILETPHGENIQVLGVVTYMRPILSPLFLYGITFHYPVDISPLLPGTSPDQVNAA